MHLKSIPRGATLCGLAVCESSGWWLRGWRAKTLQSSRYPFYKVVWTRDCILSPFVPGAQRVFWTSLQTLCGLISGGDSCSLDLLSCWSKAVSNVLAILSCRVMEKLSICETGDKIFPTNTTLSLRAVERQMISMLRRVKPEAHGAWFWVHIRSTTKKNNNNNFALTGHWGGT